MIVHPVVASVVGQVTDERWGQVLQTPHAYGVVEIYSHVGIARQRGIHILTELTKAFETPPVSLEALSRIADTVSGEGDVVSLILLVPVGKTLYLVARGKGRVYLKRETKLAMLLDGDASLSGDSREGDVIIAATDGFVRTLSSEELVGVFDHLSPVEVAEKLTMQLHEKEGGEGGSALIFHVSKHKESEDLGEELREELSKEAPVAPKIRFRKARAFGRKFTTPGQRVLIRRIVGRVRKSPFSSPRRMIAAVVLLLFAVSVVLGIQHKRRSDTKSALTETITEAKHSFDEGMALLDLNPVKGRERLTTAKELLEPVVARKLKTDEGRRADSLYQDIVDNLTRAMRVYTADPELFYDVSLLKKGAVMTDISLFEDTIGILDRTNKTVFTLGAANKSGKIVGGKGLEGATQVTLYGDKLYIWTPGGIDMVRLSDDKMIPRVIPKSEEWGDISDIASFGGNIYLLDTQKSRIWKYVAAEKGFSELFEYLNPDTLPDLSSATGMAIDGSVWLGTKTGSVLRFTSGKQNTYTPQGADTPLGNTIEVYTNDENKLVYILDSDHYRVVVFDKDGLYMSQYVWENGLPATEMVASEPLGKIFLMAGGKLYAVALQ